MATSNNDILVKIKSLFHDDGFKKLDKSVKSVSNGARTATDTFQKVTNALGSLDGKAGKVAGSITLLFSSFSQGGIFGLAMAGASMLISKVIERFLDMKNAAKEAAESFRKNFLSSFDTVSKKIGEFERALTNNTKVENENFTLGIELLSTEKSIEIEGIRQRGIERRRLMRVDGKSKEEIEEDKAREDIEVARLVEDQGKIKNMSQVRNIQNTIDTRERVLKLKDREAYNARKKFEEEVKKSELMYDEMMELEKQLKEASLSGQSGVYGSNSASISLAKKLSDLREKRQAKSDLLFGKEDENGKVIEEGLELKAKKLKKDADDYRAETRDLNLDLKLENAKSKAKLQSAKDSTSIMLTEDRLTSMISDREDAKKKEQAEKEKAELEAILQKEIQDRKDANDFVNAYENQKKREDLEKQIKDETEKQLKLQKDLIKDIEDLEKTIKAKNRDYDDFGDFVGRQSNGGGNFGNVGQFGKMMGEMSKDFVLDENGQITLDENGNPVSKDRQKKVDAAKRNLDRLSKIKNPSKSVQNMIDRNKRFLDANDPDAIKARADKLKAKQDEKDLLTKQSQEAILDIKRKIELLGL